MLSFLKQKLFKKNCYYFIDKSPLFYGLSGLKMTGYKVYGSLSDVNNNGLIIKGYNGQLYLIEDLQRLSLEDFSKINIYTTVILGLQNEE